MSHLQFHYSSRADWSMKSLRQVDVSDSLQQWGWGIEHFLFLMKYTCCFLYTQGRTAQSVMMGSHTIFTSSHTAYTVTASKCFGA